MSLQKIGDTYQGAAYPLSIPPADVEKGLLGPIVCAIKPTTGELYVGEIRDSGWGAGNNIGQIVKIKIEPENLPPESARPWPLRRWLRSRQAYPWY